MELTLSQTAFHASFSDLKLADRAVIKLSRGTSVILLVIYFLYLLFQLKSHAYLYQGTPQHLIDEESAPGFLARFDSTSSSSASSSRASTASTGSQRRVRKRLRAKLGRKRHAKREVVPEDEIEPRQDAGSVSADMMMEKTAEPEEMESQADSSRAVTATPQGAAGKDKKPVAPRGLSFRTPPVFRSSTNPSGKAAESENPPDHLRRYRSDPNNHRNPFPGSNRIARRSTPKKATAEEVDAPPMSQTASIVLLVVSTSLVALCAEFLVGSIEHLVQNSPLSEAFIGLIILPIVGNAAEHVTAVTVAAKNKLDLALGVSLGSSIQIALFVTPVVVILGWILDKEMSLYFSLFETGSLFVSTFIVNFLVLDGRSNYLEGALLCACYIIVAVGAYFFPDGQDQSSLTSGPGSG